jgi:hypothetical protein
MVADLYRYVLDCGGSGPDGGAVGSLPIEGGSGKCGIVEGSYIFLDACDVAAVDGLARD